MYTIKLSKKWATIIACGLIVSLGGLAILSFWNFKNQWAGLKTVAPTAERTLLTDLIAGNLGAERGHSDWAARYYLAAAHLSNNSTIANRAITMAYRANNPRLLLESSYFNYLLDAQAPQDKYLYAYALMLNQRTLKGILMYAQLLPNDIPHITDYTPLIPKKIAAQASFKTTLAAAQNKLKNNANAMAVIALMYLELKEEALAQQSNDRALQLAPDNVLAIQNQVTFYVQQKKPEAAIEFLQQTLQKFPDDTYVKFFLATLYYNVEEDALAAPLFTQLLEVDKLKTQSALYLGEISALKGDTVEAKNYLLIASQDKELQPFATLLLGDLAVSQKQYDEAMTWYQKVSEDPYYFQAQLAIAKVLYLEAKVEAAHDYLQNIQVNDDTQFSLLVRFETALYFMAEDWNGAYDYLNKALKLLPDDPDILYALVITDEQLGQFDSAKNTLTHTLEIDPQHIDSLNAMGELLARQYQQYDAAESYLNRALALEPNNTDALHTLGLIYYKTAHYSEAINLLQKAYTLDKDPSIAADLGEVLWVQGQQQQALLIWKNALKESPHDPQLQETMRRFLP